MFPSPCGDYGSYLASDVDYPKRGNRFRPLAGIMVLINKSHLRRIRLVSKQGFRPLAGIMVLIKIIDDVYDFDEYMEFPSPCGDYGSYLENSDREALEDDFLFPSPCGDYGSYPDRQPGLGITGWSFPSPCGDYGSYLVAVL